MSIYLSSERNENVNDSQIIDSALSLWSAILVQEPTLIDEFYDWTREDVGGDSPIKNANDLILYGIYCPKRSAIRVKFRDNLELICEKVTKNYEEKPLVYMTKLLIDNFPSPDSKISTKSCGDFFTLLGNLVNLHLQV